MFYQKLISTLRSFILLEIFKIKKGDQKVAVRNTFRAILPAIIITQ